MAGTFIGAWKQGARRAGLPLEDFLARKDAGERWCVGHKALHPASAFGRDASRPDGVATSCLEHRQASHRERYVPKPGPARYGPPPNPPRDGDKKQARQRINVLVRTGRLPNPNTVRCTDCGHRGADRRHEYDHHLGYAPAHHLDVQAVCSKCHHKRERDRRPARIDRGRESRIEGLTLVDLPRVFLTSLRVRDRYYGDVVRRAVHPENQPRPTGGVMAKPVMDPDHPEYANDDFEDDSPHEIERCPHGVLFCDPCDDCDQEDEDLFDDPDDDPIGRLH